MCTHWSRRIGSGERNPVWQEAFVIGGKVQACIGVWSSGADAYTTCLCVGGKDDSKQYEKQKILFHIYRF
jgi:hypothetical protein